jgi:hypothetical protein
MCTQRYTQRKSRQMMRHALHVERGCVPFMGVKERSLHVQDVVHMYAFTWAVVLSMPRTHLYSCRNCLHAHTVCCDQLATTTYQRTHLPVKVLRRK